MTDHQPPTVDRGVSSRAGWKWYGYAGHFAAAAKCRFHLSTRIEDYLVSTVGDYTPAMDGKRETLGASPDSFFETFVFRCDGEDENGDPIVTDWMNIDGVRYAESIEAERGHYAVCEKYAPTAPAALDEAVGLLRRISSAHGACVCGSFECSVPGVGCRGDALHAEVMAARAFLANLEPSQ